jgi:hypothetical protein
LVVKNKFKKTTIFKTIQNIFTVNPNGKMFPKPAPIKLGCHRVFE